MAKRAADLPMAAGSVRVPVTTAARWIGIAIVIGAAWMLAPYVAVIALSVWVGVFARRIHRPLTRALGGRGHAAAWITVSGIVLLAVPVGIVTASIMLDAIDLIERVLATEPMRSRLSELAGGPGRSSTNDMIGALIAQGDRAWALATRIAGTAAMLLIQVFVFVTGVFAVLVDGERWYAWIERHALMPPRVVRRLADAFMETGRGLFIGIGGAGLLQAIVATTVYLALGVPHALALGLLTLVASLIPAIGTTLIWGPVAVGLAIDGDTWAAAILAIIGVTTIATIDNLARPWLASHGSLHLPTYVVLVSMFGGIAAIGAWGLLMGPLLVRLAAEVLGIAREQWTVEPRPPGGPREQAGGEAADPGRAGTRAAPDGLDGGTNP